MKHFFYQSKLIVTQIQIKELQQRSKEEHRESAKYFKLSPLKDLTNT
jgi:hypothetical protein